MMTETTNDIRIIFGSESGGGELTAEDIAESLPEGFQARIESMADVDVATLTDGAFLFVICSTYGEGELPMGAQPFHDALESGRPDLKGLKYAVFGRGDKTYLKTFAQGSVIIDSLLAELGAERFGDVCHHDASDWSIGDDLAIEWAAGIIEGFFMDKMSAQTVAAGQSAKAT
ncbi:flavodoxin domain-containing protein [Paenarthrobacter aromaticivorans]|uniref:Flavodoxin domain-containing protein n=1 Tax=Paenarthrobacter aromaticivorans TaxID=2849150 RepID=A0ABS6I1L6_9MICC|nr:flavodoxin domain-containing protein [Paenarthrobacter sp. MMS21-TAE1-1]MBU8865635.1 flavodoxin domain-containing protein [Paenarthrobacter sp. MMS21-TAE1-1]